MCGEASKSSFWFWSACRRGFWEALNPPRNFASTAAWPCCSFSGRYARLLLGGLTWKHCPVSLGLAGLLFGIFQLIPWPGALLPWVAPGTAQLTHELLPTRPELLPGGESVPAVPFPAGSTISLHPAETRLALVRLLAVLILFAVVRNNLGSVASLRRLSVAVLVNGFLLALFAVVQFFSSPPQTVYWHIPVLNNPFGPFICKNHFPFYLNLCIGLGAGLLSRSGTGRRLGRALERSTPFNLHGLLNNPAALSCACRRWPSWSAVSPCRCRTAVC